MITITDGRGKHKLQLAKENKRKVKEFFLKNPGASKKDCIESTGLGQQTVAKYIRILLDEEKA